MRRLLLDVNVMLDILLDRTPHAAPAAALWAAIENGAAEGYLAPHAVTTIHYLIARDRGSRVAREAIATILGVLRVAAVDASVIRTALALEFPDLEDAVAAAAADASGCEGVVTRDLRGFRGAPAEVMTPHTALAWMNAGRGGA